MLDRISIGAVALTAALLSSMAPAQAFDEAQYPNLKGAWTRVGIPRFDPDKPGGLGQQAPLTQEYQAILKANLDKLRSGEQPYNPQVSCRSGGMPQMMNVYEQMEIVITPRTTYMLIDHINDAHRRIYTDGRDWPAQVEPAFIGYSIGRWTDTDGAGRYDTLEIETRHMKGPRVYHVDGIPLHSDNQTVVKERLRLDTSDPSLLLNDITVFDHALTRPWTVHKKYERIATAQPVWLEYVCADNNHVAIKGENYFVSADGYLMPARKDQSPPDLRYFNQTRK